MNLFQQPRRRFLHIGIAGFCSAFFSALPKIGFATICSGNDKGIVVHEDEGIHILTGRRKVPITIKISKQGMAYEGFHFVLNTRLPGARCVSINIWTMMNLSLFTRGKGRSLWTRNLFKSRRATWCLFQEEHGTALTIPGKKIW